MKIIEKINDNCRVKVRESILNPLLGNKRRSHLKNPNFTILSNNCWGGHVYRYFGLPYNSPTIGLYFYSEDYLRFLSNIKEYLQMKMIFIPIEESRFYEFIKKKNEKKHPVGLLGDVEIHFLHYQSEIEALGKWNRRCERIIWDNIFIKHSEQNICSLDNLKQFDDLPFKNKIVFTSKDYGLKSQILFKEYAGQGGVLNDALHFRKYIDLIRWINKETDYQRL